MNNERVLELFTIKIISLGLFIDSYFFMEYGVSTCTLCGAEHDSNFDANGYEDIEHDGTCLLLLAAREIGIELKERE